MDISLVTYGIKRQVRPANLDVKVNCLKLRDPFSVQAFRDLHPFDGRCVGYVRSSPGYAEFMKLELSKLLVAASMKGEVPLRAGVFCGMGVNRSPVVAFDLKHELQMLGHKVRVSNFG